MRQSALRWPAGYSGGKLSRSWIQSHVFDLQGFCKELPKPGRAHLVAHLYFVYARPFFVPRSNCYQGFRRFFLVVLLSPYNWVQRLSQFADTFLEVSAVLFFHVANTANPVDVCAAHAGGDADLWASMGAG